MNPVTYFNYKTKSTTLKLNYVDAPSLRLAFTVQSGTTVDIDWGDGTIVTVTANGSKQVKTFGVNTTGQVTIYNPSNLLSIVSTASSAYWNFNINVLSVCSILARFAFYGNVSGNISDVSNTVNNYLIGGTGTVIGLGSDIKNNVTSFVITAENSAVISTDTELSSLINMAQYNVSGNSKHTGDLYELPETLTILSLKNTAIPLHEVSYTSGHTWANNMRVVEVLPASGFGLTTEEVDNFLIDLSNTTWTNEKILNIAGNNAPRSITSDEAKVTLESMGVTVTVNEPLTYYVRPTGSTYGTGDGTSYANAWSGYGNINMTDIQGNILAVCGTHTEAFTFNGINFQMIGDDINESGTFDAGLSISDMVTVQNATNFKAKGITINNPNVTGLHFEDTNYYIESCYFDNSQNQGIQHYGVCNGYLKDCEFTNNVDDGISGHETATFTVDGGLFDNNEAGINTIQNCNVTIINSPTFTNNVYDIWAANATTTESNIITANGCTFPNQVLASNLAKVVLNDCNAANVVLDATGSNKGYLEATGCVIENFTPANNIATITECRLNDITSQSGGGDIAIINSYIKPVGVFDVNGIFRVKNSFFDGIDCTDHIIDTNSGTILLVEYCVFKNTPANKYSVSIRSGATIEQLNSITIDSSVSGRGIFTQTNIDVKNLILSNISQGIYTSASGVIANVYNYLIYNVGTPTTGSGTVNFTAQQTGDPLYVDSVNNNYFLSTGSPCIGTGQSIANTTGFLTADWGNSTTAPTITTQTLSSFNIGAF